MSDIVTDWMGYSKPLPCPIEIATVAILYMIIIM